MIRLGIIDFDSSHCVEYTRRINQHAIPPDQWVEGARVVLGYAGHSHFAQNRISEFTPQVVESGVELVSDSKEMIGHIDGVMILSLEGSRHLEQARPFISAGVPTYIDKPVTCDLNEFEELESLAHSNSTLVWSSSATRFADDIEQIRSDLLEFENWTGLQVFGPAHFSDTNRGLFHYGIHLVETLFTLMGSGCERLTAMCSGDCDLVSARWRDGRVGTIRGHRRGCTGYGVTCFADGGILHRHITLKTAYRNLCRAIVHSFETGESPVKLSHTHEVVSFLDAVESSRQQDGLPVVLT